MKKSVSFVVALLLAGSASLAIAQFRPEANNLTGIPNWNSGMPGLPATAPVPPIVNTPPPIGPTTPPPIGPYASPPIGPYASPPIGPYASPPIGQNTPSPIPNGAQLNHCDAAGCWGTDGTRYTRAGNVLFGSNGRICNIVSPGAPAICG